MMTGTQGENGGDAGVDARADVPSVSMSELSHVADQAHAGDAVDVTSGPTTSPSLPRQRSAVYEKYLNVKLSTPGENGGASSGGGIPEISNSNDDTEREAGEVVSDDALDNQENTPSRGNASNETGGEWQFELKRSGRTKCRVRGVPTGIPAPYQLPLVVDVVQLPHLSKFQEFLMLERRELKRFVYELHPDTMPDKVGYEEYCDYLMRGRNGVARAGVALELDQAGFKIFILPPGPASRALGYKAGNMIAVLRKRA
ncbi:hypothetical protein Poli38472_012937 [Pythium oligandrum]|uniref:Uncharacterized protein n=1 Tax=Pythium oligandrum TaxID=41045 RepID=A0A8K1CJD1_PYTOL|nr:hypothetical protein Poli38472_012937 [Pythium oligandrum]|eukprot:TMW64315.1 hypothetical protein Poli38472_012937 [Pythium oligandrum]